jgi:hypothetical protein
MQHHGGYRNCHGVAAGYPHHPTRGEGRLLRVKLCGWEQERRGGERQRGGSASDHG